MKMCRWMTLVMLLVALAGAGIISWLPGGGRFFDSRRLAWAAENSGPTDEGPAEAPRPSAGTSAEQTSMLSALHLPWPGGVVTPSQMNRAVARPPKLDQQAIQANDEVSRGSAAKVYAKASPAIVFIQAGGSFGTGFIFDADGWMLTNQHVAAAGIIDIKSGALFVRVLLGHLENGIMHPESKTRTAWVYKMDERMDLALLKFYKQPEGALPTISLADAVPTPGNDCIAIGHPKAGLLWTVRQGEITGIGQWPQDSLYTITASLTSGNGSNELLHRIIRGIPRRKVVLSSCGINPGDSGGPLLDEDGRLIAVTFGIPKNLNDQGVSLDKFSYHIHLDEVKTFIQDRPNQPRPFVPDPWPAATISKLQDLAGDGVPDTLLFALQKDQPPSGYQCDLARKSDPKFDPLKLDNPAVRKLWKFQFACQRIPLSRTFYDTKNSGQIDLILTDANRDGIADIVLRLENGEWKAVPPNGQKMFDPSLFADHSLAERWIKIHRKKAAPKSSAPAASPPPHPTSG